MRFLVVTYLRVGLCVLVCAVECLKSFCTPESSPLNNLKAKNFAHTHAYSYTNTHTRAEWWITSVLCIFLSVHTHMIACVGVLLKNNKFAKLFRAKGSAKLPA